MSDTNKRTALRVLEAFRTCDEASMRELIAEDSYEHQGRETGPIGPASPIGISRWLASAFDDLRWDVHNAVADGDLVVLHATLHGRQIGDYLGYAPTGREIAMEQVHISRIAGGKVIEHWGFRDDASILRQLGD